MVKKNNNDKKKSSKTTTIIEEIIDDKKKSNNFLYTYIEPMNQRNMRNNIRTRTRAQIPLLPDNSNINDRLDRIVNLTENWINNDRRRILRFRVQRIPFDRLLLSIGRLLTNFDGTILIESGGQNYYASDEGNLLDLINSYRDFIINEEQVEPGSDKDILLNIRESGDLIIKKFPNRNVNQRPGGAFFKYFNNTPINLEKYGIYKTFNKNNYKSHCLFKAFQESNLSKEKLGRLSYLLTFNNGENVSRKDLDKISKDLEINIIVKCLIEKTNNVRKYQYPTKKKNENISFNETYEIGLIEEHYFIIDDLPYTNYSVENCFELQNIKNWTNIKGIQKNGSYKRYNGKYNSFDLIKKLVELKETHLTEIKLNKDSIKSIFHNKLNEISDLSFDNKSIRDMKIKLDAPDYQEYRKIFFDFETYETEIIEKIDKKTTLLITDEDLFEDEEKNENKYDIKKRICIPYLISCIDEKTNKISTFFGENCGLKFLKSLENENYQLIAHNSSFDVNFLVKYLRIDNIPIRKSSKSSMLNATFKNRDKDFSIKLVIRDSLQLIPMSLAKIAKSFGLSQEKEVMPYTIYHDYYNNKNNYNMSYYPIDKALNELDKKDHKQFLDNIEKWDLYSKNKKEFDLITYSAKYCEIDCKVLKEGYNEYKNGMLKLTGLNIDGVATLASLVDKFYYSKGCYEGIKEISGIPRTFIQKCVEGGRCMTARNEKQLVKDKKIADFDARSLYPSAFDRLCNEMGGFLLGSPKVLKPEQLNYNFLKKQDGYFIKIKINKIGIKRDFPLMSKFNDKGTRIYTNDMIGEIMYRDKVSIEDMINFQQVEFDILEGYYFNEGRSNLIGKEVNNLYNARKVYKIKKNPLQVCIKLILNSGYGRMIMKAHETEIKIFHSYDDVIKYTQKNSNLIKNITELNNNTYIIDVKKSINEHFSRGQCGVEVLSMSKRIMNEVFTLAEDNGIQVYYQDTDSLHCLMDDIPLLEKLFMKKHNRKLIGSELGQFHSDFELDGAVGEVYSKLFIASGKKVYLDVVVGKDKNGNVIEDFHSRTKGVPLSCLKGEVNRRNNLIKEQTGLMGTKCLIDIHMDIYNGKKVEIDLLANKRVQFKITKDFKVHSLKKATRTIYFPN